MSQRLQPVGRWKTQILNAGDRIQLHQSHYRAFQYLRRQASRFSSGKEVFRFGGGKRLNHEWQYKQFVYKSQAALCRISRRSKVSQARVENARRGMKEIELLAGDTA